MIKGVHFWPMFVIKKCFINKLSLKRSSLKLQNKKRIGKNPRTKKNSVFSIKSSFIFIIWINSTSLTLPFLSCYFTKIPTCLSQQSNGMRSLITAHVLWSFSRWLSYSHPHFKYVHRRWVCREHFCFTNQSQLQYTGTNPI